MTPYKIIRPEKPVPVVVSIPHCGTAFPDDLRNEYDETLIQSPDDTDWFVDTLYDFAPALGITMISAQYSRWVVDLNRDRDSKPLYTDGRIITALCPTTNFLGDSLYKDKRKQVGEAEVQKRYALYYKPYHDQIQVLLDDLKSRFGQVLLWDCHSIRQVVPTIQAEKFPDLILGDADEKSASAHVIQSALQTLRSSVYNVSHNHPFKGGTITRSFGKPAANQHALQLEMTKVHYMDDAQTSYHPARAAAMRSLLQETFISLIKTLTPGL